MKLFKNAFLGLALVGISTTFSTSSQALVACGVPFYFAPIAYYGSGLHDYGRYGRTHVQVQYYYESSMSDVLIFFGLLFLDKNSNNVTFKPISNDTAQNIGMSELEKNAYNSEIDQINLAAEDAGLIHNEKESFETFSSNLSPEALSAISKIINKSFVF